MLLGQVAGKVWATKKSPALTGQAFLTVRVGERLLVCADCVGAGEGETVLVATGGAARVAAGAELPLMPPLWAYWTRARKARPPHVGGGHPLRLAAQPPA